MQRLEPPPSPSRSLNRSNRSLNRSPNRSPNKFKIKGSDERMEDRRELADAMKRGISIAIECDTSDYDSDLLHWDRTEAKVVDEDWSAFEDPPTDLFAPSDFSESSEMSHIPSSDILSLFPGKHASEMDQDKRRKKAYKAYKLLAKPTRETMCCIAEYTQGLDFTHQDVDLLPWNLEETEVLEDAMKSRNKKTTENKGKTKKTDTKSRVRSGRDTGSELDIATKTNGKRLTHQTGQMEDSLTSLDFSLNGSEVEVASAEKLLTIKYEEEHKRKREERRRKTEVAKKKKLPGKLEKGSQHSKCTIIEGDFPEKSDNDRKDMKVRSKDESHLHMSSHLDETFHPCKEVPSGYESDRLQVDRLEALLLRTNRIEEEHKCKRKARLRKREEAAELDKKMSLEDMEETNRSKTEKRLDQEETNRAEEDYKRKREVRNRKREAAATAAAEKNTSLEDTEESNRSKAVMPTPTPYRSKTAKRPEQVVPTATPYKDPASSARIRGTVPSITGARADNSEVTKRKTMYMQDAEETAADVYNSEDDRRERAFRWYSQMCTNRTDFKRRVAALDDMDITSEDIDLLPWNESGSLVNIGKMNAFTRARIMKQNKNGRLHR